MLVTTPTIVVISPKIKGWSWPGHSIYEFDSGYRVE
jgi:hypothetical protein